MTINNEIITKLSIEEVIVITAALMDKNRQYTSLELNSVDNKQFFAEQSKLCFKLAGRLTKELYNFKSDDPGNHCGS